MRGSVAQPFGQHHLLLVAAGQFRDRLVVAPEKRSFMRFEPVRDQIDRAIACRRSLPRAALSSTGSTALSRMEKSITRLWPSRSSET